MKKISEIKEFTNTLIEGGAGCGKTESIIKPLIANAINQGKAGVVYDFEGFNLSKVAYHAFVEKKNSDPDHNFEFALLNLMDINRSVRVNVLSDKYFNKLNEKLYFNNIASILLISYNLNWKKQKDQFYFGCVYYISSIVSFCYKQRERGINTLSHVISICLSDSDDVLKWLSMDDETKSILNYFDKVGPKETAGCLQLVKAALTPLHNKKVYWVLSPNVEDEFSLDITNKKKPVLFCIADQPRIQNYTSPLLSIIIEIVIDQMNYTDKADSILCLDDFGGLNFGLDNFILTNNHNHHISTYIAVQNFAQIETRYREAEQLKGKFDNLFFGLGKCGIKREQGTNLELPNLQDKRKTKIEFNLLSISFNSKKPKETLPKDPQPEFYSVGEFSYINQEKGSSKEVLKLTSYKDGNTDIPEFSNVSEEDLNNNFIRINSEVNTLLNNLDHYDL